MIQKKNTVESFELLLRSEEVLGNIFPKDKYVLCLSDEDTHREYLTWLAAEVISILGRHPETIFSLNLDHQELEYAATFEMLQQLQPYNQQLTIEITEVAPVQRTNGYFNTINRAAFKKINELGFKIAIDDVGQGINSFGNLLKVKDFIKRIKFSTLHFNRDISKESLEAYISFMDSIATELHKEFVVEGIEDEDFANWLTENTAGFHQGYFYSMPESL